MTLPAMDWPKSFMGRPIPPRDDQAAHRIRRMAERQGADE